MNYKEHWEKVYTEKKPDEVSWFQEHPKTSLELIYSLNVDKKAKIIDVGGGDSLLADHLLDNGFENITVLDISGHAIERAKKRLGGNAFKVTWIESNVLDFKPEQKFDLWHDRAAFHFLTKQEEIDKYIEECHRFLSPQGLLILGTFSDSGPEKCSGLEVHRYSEEKLSGRFKNYFDKIRCLHENHETPSHKIQNFLFCSFRHISVAGAV
ncbi:MAG: class I SAM-dependent methyltransferase [Spirochaetia bacterium]|nr:class I SAM-dependent methyltransferase [Spirochaetia bacterium]